MRPVYIVQGAQYGSEGKGQIVAWLARWIDICVRTGSINAGHTLYHRGERYKMQQIPSAWVNPHARLVIGPGAYVHYDTLFRELSILPASTGDRLLIDSRAGVHLDVDQEVAGTANRHLSIGATGKGCAEAIIRKIRDRGHAYGNVAKHSAGDQRFQVGDTVEYLNRAIDNGQQVLLEGTQGTHLDLHLGPYPFTTSRMTTAANWMAEAGLSPSLDCRVICVVRTMPIRVAGNSGPLPSEITWPDLWRAWREYPGSKAPVPTDDAIDAFETMCNHFLPPAAQEEGARTYRALVRSPALHEKYRAALSDVPSRALDALGPLFREQVEAALELTTVTKKPRRIADIDYSTLIRTAHIERPWGLIVTFLNYKFPELWGIQSAEELTTAARNYLHYIGGVMGAPVIACTTGPYEENVIPIGDWTL